MHLVNYEFSILLPFHILLFFLLLICLKVKAIGFRFRQEQTASISRNLFITCLLIIGPVSSMIFMYYQNARHCGAHFAYTQNIEQCFWPADLGGKQDPFNINLWGR